MKKKNTLLTFIAQACSYAQEHIDDADAWATDPASREELLQCVSYQAACFLSQNTVDGGGGVEWDIVLEDLTAYPKKSVEAWCVIIQTNVDYFGGWK